MRFAARSFRFALLCIAATFASTTFAVQTDLEANASSLTAGYGTQDSLLMRLSWNSAAQSLTQLALEHKRAFGERANIVVVNHAWDATALDRVSFALSASDAETIAARWRVDGQYSGKFGDQLNVVVSLGGFVSSTADGHRDHSVIPSFAWYFADRQVIEGGLRFARSDPGAQSAARGFVVYTWGAPGQDTLNVRVEGGREAYQSLGANVAVANFASQEFALNWRRWLTPDAGFGLNAAFYTNPTYSKTTLGLGAFFAF